MIKRIVILTIIILMGISFAQANDDTKIYDKNWDLEYRISEDGDIYDGKTGELRGHIRDGKVYDEDWDLEYRIEENEED